MQLRDQRIIVTGAAGLVGSQLAKRLTPANEVVAVDNLSKGSRARLPDHIEFIQADLRNETKTHQIITDDIDAVFHLAAHTDTNHSDPRALFEENTTMTYNVLEAMDAAGVSRIGFTSSSTIYGEAPRPTNESYGPLEPISAYGAAKLADEALLSRFAHTKGFTVWCFRFANVVGPHQRGNVIPDFIEKLLEDSSELTILGDGRQEKSYLYVTDCISAMCHVVEHADKSMNIYNLGTESTTAVKQIADIVVSVMGIDPVYRFTGGDRGWAGDVPKMRLDISRLNGLDWEPTYSSDTAVRRAAKELHAEIRSERGR
jgi:UDP-glucose 4-epimerase